MTVPLIVSIVVVHMLITGYLGKYMRTRSELYCGKRIHDSSCEHEMWYIASFLWPIALPLMLGIGAGPDKVANRHHNGVSILEARTLARREREKAEAMHKAELTRIREHEVELMEREAGIRK